MPVTFGERRGKDWDSGRYVTPREQQWFFLEDTDGGPSE